MKLLSTRLEGLKFIGLEDGENGQGDRFPDNRGAYVPYYNKAKMKALGIDLGEVTQSSYSMSYKGVVRGIHAEPWDKLIHVAVGKVFAVEVDLRPDSPTFGQWESFELTPDKVLYVPRGFGNSFQAMEDSWYFYLVNGEWRAGLTYLMVNFQDPDLAIPWPLPVEEGKFSDKDRNHPPLKEAFKK